MKAEWFIEKEDGISVGVMKMEGNWKDPKIRESFIISLVKMNSVYSDNSEDVRK